MESTPELEYRFSGVPIPFFNVATVTGAALSTERLQAAAEQARAWAADKGVPWLLLVTSEALDSDADAATALEEKNYATVMVLTGMLASEVGRAERVPEGLDLKLAAEPGTCESVLNINAVAYGMSFDVGQPVWGVPSFWQDHVGVVGSVDGEAVSCAAIFEVEGHHYVAMVATLPDRQRKGYADAAMRYALEAARQRWGALPTFLHATDAGRPVYERMGYKAVSTHFVAMDKALLDGSGH
jgi:GNAT superfamily N-acetyltransferase